MKEARPCRADKSAYIVFYLCQRKERIMSAPEIKYDLQIQFGNEYGPEDEQAAIEVLRKNAPMMGTRLSQGTAAR